MYLPFVNPDCVSEIKLSNVLLILLARQPDIILYKTFKSVMGRQFFKNCLGLSPLGMHVIIPNRCETGSSFFEKIQLIALNKYNFKSFQKT